MINTVAHGGAGSQPVSLGWMGCSDPQGSGRGRESINPAKMKLSPGCHNPWMKKMFGRLLRPYK